MKHTKKLISPGMLALAAGAGLACTGMSHAAEVAPPESVAGSAAGTTEVVLKNEPAKVSTAPNDNLADMSLEDLMKVDVTSVAGVAKPLMQTPAAIYVISHDDIRHTGHLSIPEALRMVPGMDVASVSSNVWAISARGFNDRFSNKLLVLVDGRTLYNDLFSGVFWDSADVVMEDIDRIEVVRGPGATLWGANAVNGVVNVVTKNAKDTQGFLVSGGVGTEEQGFGTVRFGGKIDDDAYFRVYTKYFNRDGFTQANAANGADDWRQFRGGFRFDMGLNSDSKLTIQGDGYVGTNGENIGNPILTPPYDLLRRVDTDVDGGNLLANFEHSFSTTSGLIAKAYIDYDHRDDPLLNEHRRTVDVDVRHYFNLGERNAIMWGVGYRNRADTTHGSEYVFFDPASRTEDTFSGFVQDTISIVPEKVSLMVGSKFEHNGYSGFEIQPSGRLAWNIDADNTLWTGISRAVHTPSRVTQDLNFRLAVIPPPLSPVPLPVTLRGDPRLGSENMMAYELGYRVRPDQRLSLDIATYYNRYENLVTDRVDPANPTSVSQINDGAGDSYGAELSANWQVTDRWRLTPSYTLQCIEVSGSSDPTQDSAPRSQFNVRSTVDISDSLEFNAAMYYVDNVRAVDVPAYTRLDLGVTWRIRHNTEFSVWGQNLLDDHHPEFKDPYFVRPSLEADRGVYGVLTVKF